MQNTVTIDQITDEKTKAYDEGWNSAIYAINKMIRDNPGIKLSEVIQSIENMGR